MNKKRWAFGLLGLVILAGGVGVMARGGEKGKNPAANTPFRLGKVQTEDLQISVREVGVVDPVTKVDVKSTVSGRITAIQVREGATVRRGETLAEVEPDVTQAQSLSEVKTGLEEREIRMKDAEREFNTQKSLFEHGLIGREAFRDAEAKLKLAKQSHTSAQIRYQIVEDRGIPIQGNAANQRARVASPMDGVVIKKGVELGDTITSGVSSFSAGTVVFTVADLKSLIIRVNLNEVDIAKVAQNQSVRVTLDAYPQKVFTGKVRFVAPAAKIVDKIKVFEVEVALDDLSDVFRVGMSANVEILGEKRDKAIAIPLEALYRKEGATVVYRLKHNLDDKAVKKAKEGLTGRGKFTWLADNWKDYFEQVPVQAGIVTLERAEILKGLKDGDQVSLEDPTKKKIEKDDENN